MEAYFQTDSECKPTQFYSYVFSFQRTASLLGLIDYGKFGGPQLSHQPSTKLVKISSYKSHFLKSKSFGKPVSLVVTNTATVCGPSLSDTTFKTTAAFRRP